MEVETMINGVEVDRLRETIEAVKGKPELGKFRFRAENRWIDGSHNRTRIQGFYGAGGEDTSRSEPFLLDNDEPEVLLGKNRGANPGEQVLHALAGCLTSGFVFQAAAAGIPIEAVESRIEGEIDLRGFLGISDEVRNGYQNIRVTFKIKADAPREKLEELCRLAQARSPVLDTVSHPVTVTVSLAE